MTSHLSLYKDTIKHLRFIRNVISRHKIAIGKSEIDQNAFTPYERGRLARSCERVGRNLIDLWFDNQSVMVFWFVRFAYELVEDPTIYVKPGLHHWQSLRQGCQNLIDWNKVDPNQSTFMFDLIKQSLDIPHHKIGPNITLMKLSIS